MEIKFNNVSYIYNEKLPIKKQALNSIDLQIEEEKITGIIGNCGSGKTTLIQLLNALLIPTIGEVKVDDFIIDRKKRAIDVNKLRRKVGLVFQFSEEQFFNPTVLEEVSFAMKHFNYRQDRLYKHTLEALQMVGLDESYLEKNPFNLCSSEKRKVAIASILVFNPKVIILDEPTVGLDAKSTKKIMSLLKELCKKYHKTIIIVSHDVDMLNRLVDNVVILDKGSVIMDGSKDEIFKRGTALKKYNLRIPRIVEFTQKVITEKGIKLGHYEDVKDLIKDIYRNV